MSAFGRKADTKEGRAFRSALMIRRPPVRQWRAHHQSRYQDTERCSLSCDGPARAAPRANCPYAGRSRSPWFVVGSVYRTELNPVRRLATHSETRRAYCRVDRPRPEPRWPLNRNWLGFLSATCTYSIDRLAGLLRQFKPHWLSSLLLANARTLEGMTLWRHIRDLERNHVAYSAQLAVDGQVEHCQVTVAPLDLQLSAD